MVVSDSRDHPAARRGRVLRILIAEHDVALGTFMMRSLEKEDYSVDLASDAGAAVSAIARADYDLMLLDLDIPGELGMRLLDVARQLGNGMRVLVLSSRADDLELRIACLESGADDCMLKPFAMRELKARCRAAVRRQDGTSVLRCGELGLNRLQQSLECGRESVTLSRREFGLLEYLMLNRGRCVSRAMLLERVWGSGEAGNPNVVDVYINYLRKKLGESASLIETVRGQGYRIGGGDNSRQLDVLPLMPPPIPAFGSAAVLH